jgi:nicotinate-nucleotide adenylyltransferase
MGPLGVFGGTFDPVHYGHLRSAMEALQVLALEQLLLLPAATPPHRPPPLASAAQRLHMLHLALTEFPRLGVDERELHRAGPSYSVLTLESLRAERSDQPLCLLMGMDAFLGFETWHRWQDIPGLAHLVVLARPGWDQDRLPDWARVRRTAAPADLAGCPAGHVFFLPVAPQDISATRLRAALARGESVRGQLPEAVREFICQNRLYSHRIQRA